MSAATSRVHELILRVHMLRLRVQSFGLKRKVLVDTFELMFLVDRFNKETGLKTHDTLPSRPRAHFFDERSATIFGEE